LQAFRLRKGAAFVLLVWCPSCSTEVCAIAPGERAPGRLWGCPPSEGAKRRLALVRNAAPGGRLAVGPVPSAEGNGRSMTRTGSPLGASPRRFP
jgi:hypothetical protein